MPGVAKLCCAEPKAIDAVTERTVTRLYFELLRYSVSGQVADPTSFFRRSF